MVPGDATDSAPSREYCSTASWSWGRTTADRTGGGRWSARRAVEEVEGGRLSDGALDPGLEVLIQGGSILVPVEERTQLMPLLIQLIINDVFVYC